MSRYTGPVGFSRGLLIAIVILLIIAIPPVGLIASLALAFWKD